MMRAHSEEQALLRHGQPESHSISHPTDLVYDFLRRHHSNKTMHATQKQPNLQADMLAAATICLSAAAKG